MSGAHLDPGAWRRLAESRIRSAMDAGAFENLPGAGKPIPDLDEPYDELWWVRKLLKRERLGMLPPTLLARKEIAAEQERILQLRNEAEVRADVERLNARIAELNAKNWAGPTSTLKAVDIEVFVETWKAMAAGKNQSMVISDW